MTMNIPAILMCIIYHLAIAMNERIVKLLGVAWYGPEQIHFFSSKGRQVLMIDNYC